MDEAEPDVKNTTQKKQIENKGLKSKAANNV